MIAEERLFKLNRPAERRSAEVIQTKSFIPLPLKYRYYFLNFLYGGGEIHTTYITNGSILSYSLQLRYSLGRHSRVHFTE